jgi:hypothetical protein
LISSSFGEIKTKIKKKVSSKILVETMFIQRGRLVTPKNDANQKAEWLGKMIPPWEAKCNDKPPHQKSKHSRVTNLSLYKHWIGVTQLQRD